MLHVRHDIGYHGGMNESAVIAGTSPSSKEEWGAPRKRCSREFEKCGVRERNEKQLSGLQFPHKDNQA